MEVVAQDDEAEQLPVRTGDDRCEVIDQALPVLPIVDDVLPAITPRLDVVDGAVKFNAKSSWHSGTSTGAAPVCAEKLGVESRCDAVVIGSAYLLPALSVAGASLALP
jgi:hypothetical protein